MSSEQDFYISRHIKNKLLDFEPVNERIFKSRAKLRYLQLDIDINRRPN
jgi:hypothetical protein